MVALGINPIWYGILLMINLELALITPPVGMNLFVIKGIAKAPLSEVILGALPYAALMLMGLSPCLYLPATGHVASARCVVWRLRVRPASLYTPVATSARNIRHDSKSKSADNYRRDHRLSCATDSL